MISWEDVAKIITALGGASVIAWFIINFIANILTKKIENQIKAKYDNELENIRKENSKELEKVRKEYTAEIEGIKASFAQKNYISKVRFDKEFEIYEKLSREFLDMTDCLVELITVYLKELSFKHPELYKELYLDAKENAQTAHKVASNVINSKAPFITHEFTLSFTELLNKCGTIINEISKASRGAADRISDEKCEKDIKMIAKMRAKMVCELRAYLNDLEVREIK